MSAAGLHEKVEKSVEILIIGAGPAGSVAAALLRQQRRQVLVLEREQFPRFSIGESLLPQSMEYLERCGMLRAVVEAGFQFKNGAAFAKGEQYTEFDFGEKHSPGWSTTYQVPRARFAFEQAGFSVIPAATGYTTRLGVTVVDFMPTASALSGSSWLFHEIIGIGWYYLRFLLGK